MADAMKLVAHFRVMQGMATAYLIPEDYRDRDGKVVFQGDNNNTPEWKNAQRGRRAEAFANDMIYMLDGPEERAALAEAASPPAREEAPVEGAGEPKYFAAFMGESDALRNRTSEPEAGAVAWLTRGMNGRGDWMQWEVCSEKRASQWRGDVAYRIGRRQVIQVREITHPAPATADKLRVAVEALERTRDGLRAMADDGLIENDSWAEIDQALATLNEQPQ